jgi:hypothetical protein
MRPDPLAVTLLVMEVLDALDRLYLQRWAEELGVADLLQRPLEESGP